VPGPKLAGLRRDLRYALHPETFAPPRLEDGTYVAGRVEESWRTRPCGRVSPSSLAEPWPGSESEPLMELHLDSVLITLTEARDGLPAGHTVWRP
jgi:hypothetical protein